MSSAAMEVVVVEVVVVDGVGLEYTELLELDFGTFNREILFYTTAWLITLLLMLVVSVALLRTL